MELIRTYGPPADIEPTSPIDLGQMTNEPASSTNITVMADPRLARHQVQLDSSNVQDIKLPSLLSAFKQQCFNKFLSGEYLLEIIHIPSNLIRVVIGKSGQTVTNIYDRTHCIIQMGVVNDKGRSDTRAFFLFGTEAAIGAAKSMLQVIFTSHEIDNSVYGVNTVYKKSIIKIPGEQVGLIIGKGGRELREHQLRTRTNLYLTSNAKATDTFDKMLAIYGEPSAVADAEEYINNLLKKKDKAVLNITISKSSKKTLHLPGKQTLTDVLNDTCDTIMKNESWASKSIFPGNKSSQLTLGDASSLKLGQGDKDLLTPTNGQQLEEDVIFLEERAIWKQSENIKPNVNLTQFKKDLETCQRGNGNLTGLVKDDAKAQETHRQQYRPYKDIKQFHEEKLNNLKIKNEITTSDVTKLQENHNVVMEEIKRMYDGSVHLLAQDNETKDRELKKYQQQIKDMSKGYEERIKNLTHQNKTKSKRIKSVQRNSDIMKRNYESRIEILTHQNPTRNQSFKQIQEEKEKVALYEDKIERYHRENESQAAELKIAQEKQQQQQLQLQQLKEEKALDNDKIISLACKSEILIQELIQSNDKQLSDFVIHGKEVSQDLLNSYGHKIREWLSSYTHDCQVLPELKDEDCVESLARKALQKFEAFEEVQQGWFVIGIVIMGSVIGFTSWRFILWAWPRLELFTKSSKLGVLTPWIKSFKSNPGYGKFVETWTSGQSITRESVEAFGAKNLQFIGRLSSSLFSPEENKNPAKQN